MSPVSPLSTFLLLVSLSLGVVADHHGHTKPGKPPISVRPAARPQGVSPFVVSRLASTQADLGLQLFHKLGDESPGQNLFFSPITVSAALMMLLAGSDHQTETQLSNALHLHLLRDPNPQATFQALVANLHGSHGGTNIAARIFTAKDAVIKQQFLDEVEKYHGAKPKTLTGEKQSDVATINKWVAEKTRGHIPDFVKDLPDDLSLYLLSAIFFKGKWLKPFAVDATHPMAFHVSADNQTMVPTMMANNYPLKKGRHPSLPATVAQIPFQGNTSLILLVPDEVSANLSALESSLSSQLLTTLVDETLISKKVTVHLPLISLDIESDLKKALSDIGLQELFTKPDLKKISDQRLVVSKVVHRATVDLNEEGVKATAVTGVQIMLMSAQLQDELKVDRPFIFLIRDDVTGGLLFAGRVTNPPPVAQKKKKHGDSSSSSSSEEEKKGHKHKHQH